ncbi:MAG: hypothetical protein JWL77_1388 [Chthonomonadaceae bacterium]|nr:hypothetical protein [Chthonomonadaceae bacterium]
MSYENVPWCLETATISDAYLGEAGVSRAANYSCFKPNNGTFRRSCLAQGLIVACEQAAT